MPCSRQRIALEESLQSRTRVSAVLAFAHPNTSDGLMLCVWRSAASPGLIMYSNALTPVAVTVGVPQR